MTEREFEELEAAREELLEQLTDIEVYAASIKLQNQPNLYERLIKGVFAIDNAEVMLDLAAYIRIAERANICDDFVVFNLAHDIFQFGDDLMVPRTKGYAEREKNAKNIPLVAGGCGHDTNEILQSAKIVGVCFVIGILILLSAMFF